MDAGSIKSRKALTHSAGNPQPNTRVQTSSSGSARDALLSVQAELGAALRTAKILAQEDPPITENEATETAERIADLLKASGNAFGSEAVLFQELSADRAKALLL